MEPPNPAARPLFQVPLLGIVWQPHPVKQLIEIYDKCWSPVRQAYTLLPFDLGGYRQLLKNYYDRFYIPFDSNYLGTIEKKLLPKNTEIFVRADLHGDLFSLVANLKALQEQGLLDDNFKCMPHFQMVFLGDYMDRGEYSVHVLQLLLTLHAENPDQVTLIRGNHEALNLNKMFGGSDRDLRKVLACEDTADDLAGVYQALPLATFFATQGLERQFVMFSHAFSEFEDLDPLLSTNDARQFMFIPAARVPSQRYAVTRLAPQEVCSPNRRNRLQSGAQRICELMLRHAMVLEFHNITVITTLNWGDIQSEDKETQIDHPGVRRWAIHPRDVKHYFNLNSPSYRLKLLFRGHQHSLCHHFANGKLIATTLPTSPESSWAREADGNATDWAYVLNMSGPKVREWTKTLYRRPVGSSETHVAMPVPIMDPSL